ncbi:unnamed protein product [Chironomus riparius]|uniref:Uncharacterized protein n=1 Tax=Chironomus riparius TaxID=315576 RepID=A0A9N9WUV0_9DIPT|nr:unnamed protein product [Chironomus riparius]
MIASLSLLNVLIVIQLLHPSTCSPRNLEAQIQELKIKAITSVELSSMSFDEIPSLFFLYENLVNKRFESVQKNNPKKFEEFRKIHQYYAIQNSFYSLKLRDVMVVESFNAADLDIISNKVNWTENEIISYGFLGKQKEVPKYYIKREMIFHEESLADFFIAQYFYDNLIHPKDHPSDDEMELRIRFFLHVTSDSYDSKPLTNEFIIGMIEDQNGEMISDQIRMLMKYRFRHLLDRFLPNQLSFVEKVTKMFSKDEEILGNLWGINDSQPYFLRYFRFLSSNDKVYNLKNIAEKFFIIGTESNLTSNSKKLQADNIFSGKNQILNVLYRIYEKRNENFTNDFLEVTKYQVSDDIMSKLKQERNFLDFVDSSSYSATAKREFYLSNSFNMISSTRNKTELMHFWSRLKLHFNNHELKWFITQKETSYNQTQLFLLTSHGDVSYVEAFLNLTKTYLSRDEIKELLIQRSPVSQESFITRYMIIIRKTEILELNYNFAKEYLTHDELKNLIFNNNPAEFIHKMSGNKKIFKFFMDALPEFYTINEILDMLMATDEYGSNIIFNMVTSGNKYNRRNDVVVYLKDVFKDHQDKLKELLAARNNVGQTVFGRFKDSYDKDGLGPFLELAKEIFTEKEIEELYKDQRSD